MKSTTPGTPKPERRRFPRAARLRRTPEFAAVRKNGRFVQGTFLRLAACSDPTSVRIGFVTSRRVGGAVVRNRVRRRLREIFRTVIRPEISGSWHIVATARPSAGRATFQELRGEWLILARRLSILRVSQ